MDYVVYLLVINISLDIPYQSRKVQHGKKNGLKSTDPLPNISNNTVFLLVFHMVFSLFADYRGENCPTA
jgi:hypothetical protein